MNHHTGQNKEILRILEECADECNRCFDVCMENERTEALLRTLCLRRDCARICRLCEEGCSSFVGVGASCFVLFRDFIQNL